MKVPGVAQITKINYGERGRNRTFNLLIKSQLLCQLSYAPDAGWDCKSEAFLV